MYLGRIRSLSTLSRKQPGFPFGSVNAGESSEAKSLSFLLFLLEFHSLVCGTLLPTVAVCGTKICVTASDSMVLQC